MVIQAERNVFVITGLEVDLDSGILSGSLCCQLANWLTEFRVEQVSRYAVVDLYAKIPKKTWGQTVN